MFELVTRPLGFIIKLIYDLVQNYGLAIILFTIIIKLILIPLNMKSHVAMRKQQKIQPIIAQLQKKYANDQEKLQKEMMKVYKENNVSMTGGCLPMLIQLPILLALYQVIQKPISYLAGVKWVDADYAIVASLRDKMLELFPDMVSGVPNIDALDKLVSQNQIDISSWCTKLGEQTEWMFNFNFFGLDISQKPWEAVTMLLNGDFSNMSVLLLIIIPVLAVLTTILTTKITQANNTTAADSTAAGSMGAMNVMMPLMTGYFTIILPAGMGLYWIISNVLQVVQQFVLNYYFEKKGEDFDVKLPESNRKKGKKR